MNKNRILSFIASLALVFTITGCSANNNGQTAAPDTGTSASSSGTFTETPETIISGTSDTTLPADTSAAAETTVSADSENAVKSSGLRYVPGSGTLCDEPDRMIQRKAGNVSQIVGTLYNGQAVGSDFYYYRCMLNDNGKAAYDTVHAGLLTGASTIKLTTPLKTSDIDIVYYSVLYDDPLIMWAEPGFNYTYNNSGNVISISPIYNRLVKDIPGARKALEKSVSKALAVMWELPNNIERSKYAHDYLTHTIEYCEGDLDQSAYSALVEHKTVCAGYSQAYAYMMQKMGAPCAVMVGYAREGHAWNIITLDGESYVTDVTWDDPYGNPPDTYYYDYFNITSAQMSRDHTLQSPSTYLAAAVGTKASYANYFGGNAYGTDFDDPVVISDTPDVTTAAITTKPPVTTANTTAATTKPYITTPYDWDSYWNDDWWDNYGIDPNWFTTPVTSQPPVTTTKPPVTTTKPPVTTTKPPVTTTKPPVTTTKPSVTTPYDWDSYWNDDWWDDYGIDTNGGYNDWYWDPSDDYDDWDLDLSGYDYDDYYDDYSSYFDDYYYNNDSSDLSEWWSYLDPYWKKSDWTYEGDGLWSIEDTDTGYLYLYDETDGTFYCMDENDTIYIYDSKTNDWKKL
jgi:hypothetical protein